jgi:1,4-dihydroxy-2-naphthoate octaprenyltransferase
MNRFTRGVWRVVDPRITLASVSSMILGGTAAAAAGPIHVGWLALTVLGIVCVEAAKNASGEIFDWLSGTDSAITESERTPFSGGKRVIVDGLLTVRQTAVVAGIFYAIAIAVGLAIVVLREPAVLWLGVAGVGLAYFYHAPPFKLSYRGMGEFAVALAYGPIVACGTYLVQRHSIGAEVLVASLPLGLAIACFLWINEFPDSRADALAGKRTLVVRLGRRRAARLFTVLIAVAHGAVLLLPLLVLPAPCWLGLLGLPLGAAAAHRLLRFSEDCAATIPAQAWTLWSFVVMALGMSAGFLLGS